MLTLPAKVRRKKQAYLAIRSRLQRRQVPKQAQLFFPELQGFMEEQGIAQDGPMFLRYNTLTGAELDIEFGYFTDRLYTGRGPVRAGVMPGGSFMSSRWFGPHDQLEVAHAMFVGWAKETGVEWDATLSEGGVFLGCRLLILHRSLRNESDPERYETELVSMLRGGVTPDS